LIRESDDYGAAIITEHFELLAEAETTPLQMGPLAGYARGVQAALEASQEEMDPAAVYLHNDPYAGASHSPDIGAIAPLVFEGQHLGYVGTAAHHVDIGAAVPGTCIVSAHDAFSEGLRLSAFAVERDGQSDPNAWRLLQSNVRVPELVIGDLKAQIAACRWGQNRFAHMMKRHGVRAFQEASSRLLDIAERRMRAAIGALPNGHYEATGFLDGYIQDPDPQAKDIPISLKITIDEEQILVDLEGTARQLDHAPINMPFVGTTDMAVLLTLRMLLLPETEHPQLPHNSGLFRPIRIQAPEGTLVNPTFPAPTIGRFCGGQMVANLLVKALAPILRDRACAGCSTTKAITFSGWKKGKNWIHMDVTEGAYGATQEANGLDAVDVLYANTKNNPIEDIEVHYPLRVERYELREGSGGRGRTTGGIGPIRETRMLVDGHVSVEGDGFRHPPWGLFGGEDGATGGVEIEDASPDESATSMQSGSELLPSKVDHRPIKAGTLVRDLCPSGGGFGSALPKRDNSE